MYRAIYNKEKEYLVLIRVDKNDLYIKDNKVIFYYNKDNYASKSFVEFVSKTLINKNRLFLLFGDVFKTIILNDGEAVVIKVESISKRTNYIMSFFKKDLEFLNNKEKAARSIKKYGIKPTKHIRRQLPRT